MIGHVEAEMADEEAEELRRELRRRQRQRVTNCCARMATMMLSHIGLAAMVVAYSIMGGFLFRAIEAPAEQVVKVGIVQCRERKIDDIWQLAVEMHEQNICSGGVNETSIRFNFTDQIRSIMIDFKDEVVHAVKVSGWDGEDDMNETKLQWSFAGALLYAVTVITTIGYGHVAPKTEWGRILTMLYALVGIPLTFLYLSNIGNLMANCFRMFYKRVCCDILCCQKCDRARRRERLKQRRMQELAVQRNILLGIQPALVGMSTGNQFHVFDVDPITTSTIVPDVVISSDGEDCDVIVGGGSTTNECSSAKLLNLMTSSNCKQNSPSSSTLVTSSSVFSSESSLRSTDSRRTSSRSTLIAVSRRSLSDPTSVRETAILDDDDIASDPSNDQELDERESRSVGADNGVDNVSPVVDNSDSHRPRSTRRRSEVFGPQSKRHELLLQVATLEDVSRRESNTVIDDRHPCHCRKLSRKSRSESSSPAGQHHHQHQHQRKVACRDQHSDSLHFRSRATGATERPETSTSPSVVVRLTLDQTGRSRSSGSHRRPSKPHSSTSTASLQSSSPTRRSDEVSSVKGDEIRAEAGDLTGFKSDHARANWSRLRKYCRHQKTDQKLRSPSHQSPLPPPISNQEYASSPSRSHQSQEERFRHRSSISVARSFSDDVKGTSANLLCKPSTSATLGSHSVSFHQSSRRVPEMKAVVDRTLSEPSTMLSSDYNPYSCRPDVRTSSSANEFPVSNHETISKCPRNQEQPSHFLRKPEAEKYLDTASGCNTENCFDGDERRQVSYEFEPFDLSDNGRQKSRYDPFGYEPISTEHEGKVTVPITICLIIIAGYIFAGAVLFTIWEDWDYLTGSYFCFITLSTIGFGDIVPGTDMDKWASHEKLVLCTLWLAFGLSLLAMCFNLMQEEVKEKCKWIGRRLGLIRDDEQR